jgi:hypothetical protein
MESFRQYVTEHKVFLALAGGAVLGLLLGLLIGWVLWPVTWDNSSPANLRWDYRSTYIRWVANEYAESRDLQKAGKQLGIEHWKDGQFVADVNKMAETEASETVVLLRQLAEGLDVETNAEGETPEQQGFLMQNARSLVLVCGVSLLVLALLGGALLIFSRWRENQEPQEDEDELSALGIADPFAPSPAFDGQQAPLAQFVTTYAFGDDDYDPSFNIELPNGEFMGECGIGIAEMIGVGEPSKVTAFELWLFDRNDIRTVTKVLMSDYAFEDEALRAKLAPKGELVVAERDAEIVLETKRIRVQAHIVDAEYGQSNLPRDSYFENLTIELEAWGRSEGEAAQETFTDIDFDFG